MFGMYAKHALSAVGMGRAVIIHKIGPATGKMAPHKALESDVT